MLPYSPLSLLPRSWNEEGTLSEVGTRSQRWSQVPSHCEAIWEALVSALQTRGWEVSVPSFLAPQGMGMWISRGQEKQRVSTQNLSWPWGGFGDPACSLQGLGNSKGFIPTSVTPSRLWVTPRGYSDDSPSLYVSCWEVWFSGYGAPIGCDTKMLELDVSLSWWEINLLAAVRWIGMEKSEGEEFPEKAVVTAQVQIAAPASEKGRKQQMPGRVGSWIQRKSEAPRYGIK